MTTVTVNDITDVARILREQPEWADTIRNLLLSRDEVCNQGAPDIRMNQ